MARIGIRGSRVGAGPGGEGERGPSVNRVMVTFWLAVSMEKWPETCNTRALCARNATFSFLIFER